jgi:hypothetical protein
VVSGVRLTTFEELVAVTDSNLRRIDGVSEAGAVSRNPERSEGPGDITWWAVTDSNLSRIDGFDEKAVTGYSVVFPNGLVSRCNPVNASPNCDPKSLESTHSSLQKSQSF